MFDNRTYFIIGAFFPVDRALTPENIRDGWDVVNDFKDATVPTGIQEALGPLMQNLQNKGENARFPGGKPAASAAPAAAAPAKTGGVAVPGYKSSVVFEKVCSFVGIVSVIAVRSGKTKNVS